MNTPEQFGEPVECAGGSESAGPELEDDTHTFSGLNTLEPGWGVECPSLN